MFTKLASLAAGLAAAATFLPAAPAHAAGVNDCNLYVSGAGSSATCDYVGAGAFTVIDFDQYTGDVDATVSCTTFSGWFDYSTYREVLTGPTKCTMRVYVYSTGSGRLHVYNKTA